MRKKQYTLINVTILCSIGHFHLKYQQKFEHTRDLICLQFLCGYIPRQYVSEKTKNNNLRETKMAALVTCMVLCMLMRLVGNVCAQTDADISTWFSSSPWTDYDKRIVPLTTQTDRLLVYIQLGISSVTSLDERTGVLHLAGYVDATWTDQKLVWSTPASINQMLLTRNDVWTPSILVKEGVNSLSQIGDETSRVTVSKTGKVAWKPGIVIKSACRFNANYFPYDKQTCSVTFSPWQYTSNIIQLLPVASAYNTSGIQVPLEYELSDVKVTNTSGVFSEIKYDIVLKRKSGFFVTNSLLPILLLGILNGFVFVVPHYQGRLQYVFTGFVIIAVYVTTLSQVIPKSSNPTPLLILFFLWQIMIGLVLIIMTILTLRIYSRHGVDKVPWAMKRFLSCLWCYRCRGKSITDEKPPKGYSFFKKRFQLHTVSVFVKEFKMKRKREEPDDRMKEKPRPTITWKTLGATIDILFFFIYFGLNVSVYCMFILPLLSGDE